MATARNILVLWYRCDVMCDVLPAGFYYSESGIASHEGRAFNSLSFNRVLRGLSYSSVSMRLLFMLIVR
jgi:hypothetical protein